VSLRYDIGETVMRLASIAVALALIVPFSTQAQGQKGGPHGNSGNNARNETQSSGNTNVNVNIVFGDRDRAIIGDYYRAAPGGGPKSMPPGHAKQLARNGTLPPGIAKKQLPGDLIGRLPSVPRGYDRVIIGNDVVLVQISTNTIMDIIQGVVR
jgi:hypothetical protein